MEGRSETTSMTCQEIKEYDWLRISKALDGLNPKASNKIITAYITPKLLYGLEAARLNKGEMKQLEVFYRGILWSSQGLTDHVASEAVYLLLCNISLEGQLHIRCLTLYGAITRIKYTHSTVWPCATWLLRTVVHTPGLYGWETSLIYMELTGMHLSPHPGPNINGSSM